jgi:hypothetical protein
MSNALEAALRMIAYVERLQRARGLHQEEIHRFDAGEDSETCLLVSDIIDVTQAYCDQIALFKQLADIRDMFPAPANGSELDVLLLSAIAHPEDVAAYVKAQLQSLQEREPVAHQFQTSDGKWYDFLDEDHKANTIADGRWPIRALYDAPVLAKDSLEDAIKKLHTAKGRYHTQLAACDLFDLLNLPNERPTK